MHRCIPPCFRPPPLNTLQWHHRTPPHISAKFTLCKNLPNCHYGGDCNFAHSQPELVEWQHRARLRQLKHDLYHNTAARVQETELHKQVRRRLHGNLRQLPPAHGSNLVIANVPMAGKAR